MKFFLNFKRVNQLTFKFCWKYIIFLKKTRLVLTDLHTNIPAAQELLFVTPNKSQIGLVTKGCFTQNGWRKFAITFVALPQSLQNFARLPDSISSICNMFFESLDPIERVLPSLKMLIFDHFVLRQKVG